MCGLVGVFDRAGSTSALSVAGRMISVLHHRGPDDDGFYASGRVAFGFRRLSILDLSSAGHQPMAAGDGRVTIVFNGEIYNYVELRRELEALGHQFCSTGDTEVLLHAYLEWGTSCLPKLNGMWAFLIHDARSGKLFGARDRFGIKPLFRHVSGDVLLFASEIKAIVASGVYSPQPDWSSAASFLVDGRLDNRRETFFVDVVSVPAATAFEVDPDGKYREWTYWRVEDSPPAPAGDFAEAFAELFEDAVRIHMRSDVPVAVHLSGGLDSSSILCASGRVRAAAGAKDPLLAFSYMAPEFDESVQIHATVRQANAQLVVLEPAPARLWADLERMLWFQDEPVHSMSALVSYQLMRLAAEHGIKVVLNGQGADETIGGYASYFRSYWHTLILAGRVGRAWTEIRTFAQSHEQGSWPLAGSQLKHLLFILLGKLPFYRAASRYSRRKRLKRPSWLSADLLRHFPERDGPRKWDLNSDLALSQRAYPLPLYLRVEDRNSMAHSIEVRLPFLDHRLVSLVYSLPPEWKLRGPWNKFVLREAMRGRIPEEVRGRIDKMGFPTAARDWIAGPLFEPIMDVLASREVKESGRYDATLIVRDLERHRCGEVNLSWQIFAVTQFELWLGSFRHARRGAAVRAARTAASGAAA